MSEQTVTRPAKDARVDTSPSISDEVKTTTCYMCACRCGIKVHLRRGQIRYIEGNPDHPVNNGVLCAKGAAGIMHQYSPAKLTKPLLRVGERGSGEFREIEWDEALDLAESWLREVRARDPKKLAFFTGRDQSQALTSWWAAQYGTPNYAAHGGFCSVNMAAAGLYTIGGSFWEFGEPDWERTRYFIMFGVAEDHNSNPIKAGLGRLKSRGDTKFVSVNPVRTGYSAIADEWIGLRPGTDGLFVLALIHELLKADKVDWEYLVRYTNSPWLVVQDPGSADHGLFARDEAGNPLCMDGDKKTIVSALDVDIRPQLTGKFELADGRQAVPAFHMFAERYLDPRYSAQSVAGVVGVPARQIRRIAAEIAEAAFEQTIELDQPWVDWAGRRQEKMIGRPVSMHAMRGISAHSNGFHTCRLIHLLQMLIGSIDVPGGFRYKPPFPKPIPPAQKPAECFTQADTPLNCQPLGFTGGPEDLLVDDDGAPMRIDKAFSWEYPLAIHGMMHMVLHNAWAGDPYPVDVLFMYMANMAWNSSMNVSDTLKYLTDKDPETGDYKIPKIIYSDAFYSETVPYADLVLPDTTYLERWDCISLLDRPISSADGPADAIRQPVLKPDRDVRPFQDVLLELGARLGLPGMTDDKGKPRFPGGYPDYLVNHLRAPGIGPLAGWRDPDGSGQGRGEVNPDQIERYLENGCFWKHELEPHQKYYKMANWDYLRYAHDMGWIPKPEQIVLQLYSETLQKFRLAADGFGPRVPPEKDRDRIRRYFEPLPMWYPPLESENRLGREFPLHALTQRPMHMYHSWGSQNAWLRQITTENRLFVHHHTAAALDIRDDDWVWIVSPLGRVKARIKCMDGVNPNTVWTWNAIGKRRGAWNLAGDAPESERGFLLNHVINDLLPPDASGTTYSNSDPVTGQGAWYDLVVRLEKCLPGEAGETEPRPAALARPKSLADSPRILRYGGDLTGSPTGRDAATHIEFIGNQMSEASGETGPAPKPLESGDGI